MQEQIALQNLLQGRFNEARRKNPHYSLRSFARRVGLNSGALSSILNGKRNVSEELARRIMERLLLDPQERSDILRLFPVKRKYERSEGVAVTPDQSYVELSAAQYRLISEWEHYGILTLMRTKNFKSDVEWIAQRLMISASRVERAISRLISIGIVERLENGELKRSPKKFRSSDDVANLSVKRSNEETLDLAKDALHEYAVDQRDYSHVTLAIDPQNLSMAKELIRKFQDDFAKLVESGQQTEVYRLSMQFFPLSNIQKKEAP